jgi:hypothetical protein
VKFHNGEYFETPIDDKSGEATKPLAADVSGQGRPLTI